VFDIRHLADDTDVMTSKRTDADDGDAKFAHNGG
jgi:hypothetical protein